MRLLITGGAGFIGSNFVRYCLREHAATSILNVDKLTYAGNLENLRDVESRPGYQFVQGDVTDHALLNELFATKIDAVIHFAAETHVDRSIANAAEFVSTNVAGTQSLLDTAWRHKVERFIHISTDEVYGSLEAGEISNENCGLKPNSPYAASKAAADLVVRSYWKTYGFPAIVTRCTNNYGPFQFPEKLIPLMITNALEGKRLPVYGDGMNERDWIFVEDHCRAIYLVLMRGVPGEIYNIGSHRPVSNLEMVRRLLLMLGSGEDLIEFVSDRPGHDRRYALNSKKIRDELGWEPLVSLEEGLVRTAEWYRSNSSWVQRAKDGEYRKYYQTHYHNRDVFLASL